MQSGEHDVPADVAEGSKDVDRQIKRHSAQTALSQSLRGPLFSTRHAFRNTTTIGRTIYGKRSRRAASKMASTDGCLSRRSTVMA